MSNYYVNIDTTYIDTSNVGTSADPFNFDELSTYLLTSGITNDVFNTKGVRTLTIPSSASLPYTALQSDSSKNFTIDAWDAANNGPWILIPEDYYINGNMILDLKGCTLKNGIIYNNPYLSYENYYGGILKFSTLIDMWIVYQGIGSSIECYPSQLVDIVETWPNTYNSANTYYENTFTSSNPNYYDSMESIDYYSSINLGNTIYSENGIFDNNEINNIRFEDSILFYFKNLYNTFTNAELSILNCVLSESQSATSADFNSIVLSKNQYNFSIPSDLPFLVNSTSFGQTMDWLKNNLGIFKPFAGITSPPQQGNGNPNYTGYDKGLFDSDRKSYNY